MNVYRLNVKSLLAKCLRLTLLILSFTSTAVIADVHDDLNLDVDKAKSILHSMHKKAKKALVNAAQDNTFDEYFTTHDDDHKHELKEKIDNISLSVQAKFDVAEMCLIDPNGSEISRIVGSKIAYDLSNEEASADFFAPSFAQRARTVYQSPIYMSPDVDRWVVAYVTPVVAENEKKAILHYEIGLDVFQKALTKVSSKSNSIKLVVSAKGWIIWQQDKHIQIDKITDDETHSTYFEHFEFGNKNIEQVVKSIDEGEQIPGADGESYLGAYRKVGDWYTLALEQAGSVVVSQSED